MVAVLAAEPGPTGEPPPRKETVAQDAPTARDVNTGADRQKAVSTPEAAPEPAPSPDTPVVESDATTPGKAGAKAGVVAVLAAEPGPTGEPPPRKETVAQDAPTARDVNTGADRQKAVSTPEAAPEPAPSPDTPVVESDATTPGKAGAKAGVVVGLAAATPSSPVTPETSLGNADDKSATDAKGPRTTEPENPATVSPSTVTTEKTTSAEETPSGDSPEASLRAKAETSLQSTSETGGSATAAAGQLDIIGMESRLRSFLQTYCNTYAAKDLDRFTQFFSVNAMENGKLFDSLLPKYERNFQFIETIQYRIELQDFSVAEDQQTITIDGDFFLKWLPPDKKWRENSGKISMNLIEKGSSFIVQQLDYHGNPSPKK